ncbi:MAG: hypothetical protein GWN84_00420 [Gammaproteobacteria bacterium]|nr:hypothetical protein [Gammaproteobacteria bacterium]NIR81667.1 hypothetical protein [Gammaproteobacteria bacterium]NIU02701.1 hypothetical protein [Gammaproteobacteria bacterium]NIV73403.1 hypothetical protein [Gammaproteobacteria bacterium]NIX83976.1 hypothetical protein [Gammaproteobacteria bacterium]
MDEKQELIKKMIQMQKQFIRYEHSNGVDPAEYYVAPEGHELHNYREEYRDVADKVVELAHSEKGSRR